MPPRSTTKSTPTPATGSKRSSRKATLPVARSTGEASPTSPRTTSPGPDRGTSSPASAAGPTQLDLLGSLTTVPSGPAPARAKGSPTRARGSEHSTLGIFGQHGQHSSQSVALQSSLENRLRADLDSRGSTLFSMTWNDAVTPSGRRICALRGSALRTSDSASISWPTPVKEDARSSARHGYMLEGNQGTTLLDAARTAGWATPVATELGNTLESYEAMKANMTSGDTAQLSSWATPTARDGKGPHGSHEGGDCLSTSANAAAWPTPCSQDGPKGGPSQGADRLPGAAAWPTPQAGQADSGYMTNKDTLTSGGNRRGHEGNEMLRKAHSACWPTPTSLTPSTDTNREAGDSCNLRKMRLMAESSLHSEPTLDGSDTEPDGLSGEAPCPEGSPEDSGEDASGSSAATKTDRVGGQLRSRHSGWLMGYPAHWELCAPTVRPKRHT